MSQEFHKIICDFVSDLKTTFPEYTPLMDKWWKNDEKSCKLVFEHCQKKMPPRFFDILNKNEDMFKEASDVDTEFLPSIHFRSLWNYEITQTTRDAIWKYLQLMLFSIVGSIDNKDMFGDTAKLFEDVDADELKTKLEETLKNMQDMFENMKGASDNGTGDASAPQPNPNFPNAEDIHEHISGMLGGKLGKLAKEIAEDAANDLDIDMDNVTDVKDVFSNLMKNPSKLTGLVKNVGAKLDSKIKSGELKESELIAEASELMQKMKNMPGMGDIQSMLNKMGMQGAAGAFAGGGKVNMGAMESQLNRNMKTAKMKERIRAKAEVNRILREKMEQEKMVQAAVSTQQTEQQQSINDEELISIFSTGEKVEKTPRGAKPTPNKKKKGKK
jgi:hypothetical protein